MTTVTPATGIHHHVQRPRISRTRTRESLPSWPLALPFIGYGPGWLLGLGDIVWPLSALVMIGFLARTRNLRLPPLFGMWLLFLAWVVASVINIDSGVRLIGFTYRGLLYGAATVMAVYAYNASRAVSVRYLGGLMAVFLGVMTLFGWVALGYPLATVHTPLGWVVPGWMQSNALVQDMTVRRLTQFDPSSFEQTSPRPSAPFLYTNTWGNIYSLVLPLAALYAWQLRRSRLGAAALAVIALSVVPAALTLNRGMLVGLVTVLVVVVLHQSRTRRPSTSLAILGSGVVGMLALGMSPVGDRFTARLAQGSSTTDRWALYRETLSEVSRSPLLGFGAPRPSVSPWLPSLGTQGQIWTVLFAHGVVALALFLGWFLWSFVASLRSRTIEAAVLCGIVAATIVEATFYGMMTGLTISLMVSCLVFRPDLAHPGTEGRGDRDDGALPSSGRRGRVRPDI